MIRVHVLPAFIFFHKSFLMETVFLMDKKKIVLSDAYKGFTLDQDKTVSPVETLNKFKEKLKQTDLDILAETRRIDNNRLGIPVFFSVCGKDAASLTGTKKQMGKGGTPEQAEASAVMELAERFSFFSFKNRPDQFRSATYPEVKDDALSFEAIAKSVHDESEEKQIVKPFFEQLKFSWTWAYNLTREKPVLIPFDWFYTINEFNGTSAGNCTEEALCQGICEIVERHVSAVINAGRISVPLIRPNSVKDPLALEMIQKYNSAGVDIFLSDFSLDMGIPTVGVLAHDPSTFPEKSEIVWTAGTTPGPDKALSRALAETAQLAGDFNTGSNYVASGLPKFQSLAEAAFITRSEKIISLQELPDISNDNIRTEVENCLSRLAQKQMDVIAIETTHPILAIPAFYTIVPGARFRERSQGANMGMFTAKMITGQLSPVSALAVLSEMDKVLPGKYYLRFYTGSCYLTLGDPATALSHFSQALELGPTDEDAAALYAFIGVCHRDLGNYRAAVEALIKGCAYDDTRPDIYNLMGFCHFKRKEHEKAIDCFKKAIRLNPGSAIDYANIASNYRDMGNRDQAVEYYRKALDIDPGIDFARENLIALTGKK